MAAAALDVRTPRLPVNELVNATMSMVTGKVVNYKQLNVVQTHTLDTLQSFECRNSIVWISFVLVSIVT